MNAARWRIAGAGDSEKGWKRLLRFSRTRASGAGLDVADVAFWVRGCTGRVVPEGVTADDGVDVRLIWPWRFFEGRHLSLCELKLRMNAAGRPTVSLELATFCRRIVELWVVIRR